MWCIGDVRVKLGYVDYNGFIPEAVGNSGAFIAKLLLAAEELLLEELRALLLPRLATRFMFCNFFFRFSNSSFRSNNSIRKRRGRGGNMGERAEGQSSSRRRKGGEKRVRYATRIILDHVG